MLYLKILGLIVLLLLGYVLFVFLVNRFHTPKELSYEPFDGKAGGLAGDEISVATWNIGYAGMGEESDFVMDLGTQTRPLSGELVDKNLAGIEGLLASLDTDVILLQEVARPSLNTYNRDVFEGIREKLASYAASFTADIHPLLMPPPLNVRIGNALFTRLQADRVELRLLEFEPTYVAHTFRKNYRMHVMRPEGPQRWVLVSVHLSAFDAPENSVREKQLRQVIAFARQEYAAGAHVVVGGDWNLRLNPAEFPHATEKKYQFWVRDLPEDATPEGWQWAVDPSEPTVRTANKPYVDGENMTLIVDGFLVSPNVEILDVRTLNQDFRFSDHNPVTARFRVRPQD